MIRKIASLLFVLFATVALHAQTYVIALAVTQAGQPLASGLVCFQPTNSANPGTYSVGSLQAVPGVYCGQVFNGMLQPGFAVTPSPLGSYYHVFSASGAGPFTVIHDYGTVPITGASWSLDTFGSASFPFLPRLATSPATAVVTDTSIVMSGGSLQLPSVGQAQSIFIANISSSASLTISTTAGQALDGTVVASQTGITVTNYGGGQNWFVDGSWPGMPASFVATNASTPYTVLSTDGVILEAGGSITLPLMTASQTVFIFNTSSSINLLITATGGTAAGHIVSPGSGVVVASWGNSQGNGIGANWWLTL